MATKQTLELDPNVLALIKWRFSVEEDILLNQTQVQRIANNYQSGGASRILRWMSYCTCLHIGCLDQTGGGITNLSGYRKTLRHHNPFRSSLPCCTWPCKLLLIWSFCANTLVLINFAVQGYHDLQLARLVNKQPSEWRSSTCIKANQNSTEPLDVYWQLRNIDRLLDMLGVAGPSVMVFSTFYHGVIVGSSCNLLLGSLTYGDNESNMDALSYTFSPVSECSRLSNELDRLIDKIRRQANNYYRYRDILTAASRSSLQATSTRKSSGGQIWPKDESYDQLDAFEKILNTVKLHDLVRPATFSMTLMRRMMLLWNIEVLGLIGALMLLSLAPFGLTLAEAHRRVEARLQQASCHKQDPSLVFSKQHAHVNLSEPSQWLDAAEFDDTSVIKNFASTLMSELPQIATWPAVIQSALEISQATYLTTWVWFYFALIFPSAIYSLAWTRQLETQLKTCLECFELVNQGDLNKSETKEFELAITAAYINFELFRKEHNESRKLNATCSSLITLVLASTAMLAVVIHRYIATDSSRVLILWTLNNILIGSFFYFGYIYMSYAFSRLYKIIFEILARTTSLELELHHTTDLWRRQLSSQNEMMEFFAPRLLGVQSTTATLITSLVYVAAFLLLVLFSD